MVYKLASEPYQESPVNTPFDIVAKSISREELDQANSKLLDLPRPVDDASVALFQYAYEMDALCIKESYLKLDKSHWIHDYVIRNIDVISDLSIKPDLDKANLIVRPLNPRSEFVHSVLGVETQCQSCSALVLSGPLGDVTIKTTCVYANAVLYIPSLAYEGDDICFAHSFDSSSHYDDKLVIAASESFERLLISLNKSPEEVIAANLSLDEHSPFSQGQAYMVTFDENNQPIVSAVRH
jgi:hypothetical protein